MIDLRLGRYQDVLADVECDAVIVDAPYSERTHAGHDDVARAERRKTRLNRHGTKQGGPRTAIGYDFWTPRHIREFVDSWGPRTRRWMVSLTSDDLIQVWRAAYRRAGLVDFAPLPCVMRGMSVRVAGDGPSSWSVYAVVARRRNRAMATWGTLPGAYIVERTAEWQAAGGGGRGKSMDLMRALVSDYSRPGDLVCDPCAGYGSTLAAAAQKGRRAIGAEVDPAVHAEALVRLSRVQTVDLFAEPRARQAGLL